MKHALSVQDLIASHIRSDEISDVATQEGDYKTNNREGKKINGIFLHLREDLAKAEEVYSYLLGFDNITTRTEAAAACLKLNILVDRAEQILVDISKMSDIGIRRLNAEMVLRVWRGEYPGKTL